MDRVAMLQRTIDGAAAMVGALRADELTRPTPCTEWDVRGLVEHMIGVCALFGAALDGEGAGQPGAPDTDLAGRYGAASRGMMEGWRGSGALQRTLRLPFGEMPAAAAITVALADQLLHTWDLARALGRPYAMDADLAEASLAMMKQMMRPEFRGPGKGFAEEVPCAEDAPIQDRLLAFSGRRP